MSIYYKEYTLVFTRSGVSVYGNNGFIQSFSTEDEAVEYLNELNEI